MSIPPAYADQPAKTQNEKINIIEQWVNQQNYTQALSAITDYLAQYPKDVQMRFTQAFVLSRLDKTQKAQQAFEQLIYDFPELPEPYNNLAVLYAQVGDYPAAQKALETALQINPNYALAYFNLGEIYLKRAQYAYQKSLELTPKQTKNKQIRQRLTNLNSLINPD